MSGDRRWWAAATACAIGAWSCGVAASNPVIDAIGIEAAATQAVGACHAKPMGALKISLSCTGESAYAFAVAAALQRLNPRKAARALSAGVTFVAPGAKGQGQQFMVYVALHPMAGANASDVLISGLALGNDPTEVVVTAEPTPPEIASAPAPEAPAPAPEPGVNTPMQEPAVAFAPVVERAHSTKAPVYYDEPEKVYQGWFAVPTSSIERDRLLGQGHEAHLARVEGHGTKLVVGPFASRNEADLGAGDLFVVPADAVKILAAVGV